MNQIVMIGCGGVGFCLLEVFKKEVLYYECKFVIIEPKKVIEDLDEVMKGRNYIHIKKAITKENHLDILSCVDSHTFIINVSVNVDSIMLLELAKVKNAWYIDTSIEQYQDFVHTPIDQIKVYSQFEKNNLYHQNLEAFKVIGKSKKTRIVSGGMNPAMINEYAKKALNLYAESKGKKLENGDYAKLGHELGLKEILVVEYDSQVLKVKSTKDKFVNTWSSIGFQEEAEDLVMLSLNNGDLKKLGKTFDLIKPNEGSKGTHIRFIPKRGMDMVRETIGMDYDGKPFKFTGMLIPHAEIITMSDFFTYKGNAPSIMYIYRPCDEAIKSLEFFKKNDYEELPKEIVVRGKDISKGWDSIGALLTFSNGDIFGGWTVCSIQDAKKLGFKSGPTCLQVCGFMVGAIKWALLNPKKGLNNAETIPHKFIFKHGSKYMGKEFFCKINL
jgi:homospermidine synthase